MILFHAVGILLVLKEELNRCFRVGATDSAVPLSIWQDTPSGPVFIAPDQFLSCSYTECLCLEGWKHLGRTVKCSKLLSIPLTWMRMISRQGQCFFSVVRDVSRGRDPFS